MDRVPVQVQEGGSVLDATHSPVRSLVYPARTVALTFDDGPDPQWTPQILAVLRKHQVPGTFFVLGGKVVRHPGLVRDIRASGSQVGLHTFTHPDLGAVSPARLSRELSESQIALAGATGEISYLVRPPYSSGVSSVDNQQLQVLAELGRHGYVTALSDVDSRDWEHTDPAAIVAAAIPRTGAGGAVLLHDSGGNRAATVAALDRLIPELKTRGYRFTTVTDAVNLPAGHHPRGPRRPHRRPDPDRHRVAVHDDVRRAGRDAVRRRWPGRGPTAGHDRRGGATRASGPADCGHTTAAVSRPGQRCRAGLQREGDHRRDGSFAGRIRAPRRDHRRRRWLNRRDGRDRRRLCGSRTCK